MRFFLFVVVFLCFDIVVFSQQNCSFNALKKYNVSVDHLPGEYEKKVSVVVTCPKGTSIELNTNSWKSSANGGRFEVESTDLIKLTLSIKGRQVDSQFVGLYVIGKDKWKLPVVSLYLNKENFCGSNGIITGTRTEGGATSGRVWSKSSMPTYFEYHEGGKLDYGNNFKIKPFGGWTLGMKEKSLRIYADTLIGPKSIKIRPFHNKPYTSYKSLVLRTSGTDQRNTRLKDISLCSIAKDMGLDYQDFRQSVLYVNGEYWGIYNIREKVNLEFLKYNHGAEKDKKVTELLELSGERSKDYRDMISYIGKDFPNESVIDSINTRMDLENYLNYIIFQIHIQNVDSRGNVRYWKSESLDNRWRWIFYDTDLGCPNSRVNFNYLQKRLSSTQTDWYNPTWSTSILRNLVKHKPVKNLFINEYCLLLATKLNKDTIQRRIDYFASNIRHEIPDHVLRRGSIYGESVKGWENQVNYLKRFFDLRYPTAFEHIMSCFNLHEPPVTIQIGASVPGVKAIRLKSTSFLWDQIKGDFFPEVPLILEATNLNHMYRFKGWSDGDKSETKEVIPTKGLELKAIYERKKNATLYKNVVVSSFALKQSKKDTFYLIGLFNCSDELIVLNKVRIAKNGSDQFIVLDGLKIKPFQQCYITNKPKKAKKKFGIKKCLKTELIPGFDLAGGEWVLLSEKDDIIDSMFITVPDSNRYFGKMSEFYRNFKTGKWVFEKKQKLPQEEPVFSAKKPWIWYGVLGGLILAVGLLIGMKRMRKNTFMLLLLIAFHGQAQYKDQFGLDSVQTKLVNNKGKGYDSLSGLRNVRVVLKNLLYRGGNNNPLSVQNPLTIPTLHALNELGFDDVIYLYSKNYKKYFPEERIDSLAGTGLNYSCMPRLDSISTRNFLTYIYQKANDNNDSLVYIHCWNGWHQSGWLAAMTLIQFCDLDNEMAVKYWANNTDKNYVGYGHVKSGILSFKPYPELSFTEEQKLKHCPCMDTLKLNELYDLDELLGKKKEVEEKKKKEEKQPTENNNSNSNDKAYYVVQSGDTLSKIAQKENTTVSEICRLSGISAKDVIRKGQRLRVR